MQVANPVLCEYILLVHVEKSVLFEYNILYVSKPVLLECIILVLVTERVWYKYTTH